MEPRLVLVHRIQYCLQGEEGKGSISLVCQTYQIDVHFYLRQDHCDRIINCCCPHLAYFYWEEEGG